MPKNLDCCKIVSRKWILLLVSQMITFQTQLSIYLCIHAVSVTRRTDPIRVSILVADDLVPIYRSQSMLEAPSRNDKFCGPMSHDFLCGKINQRQLDTIIIAATVYDWTVTYVNMNIRNDSLTAHWPTIGEQTLVARLNTLRPRQNGRHFADDIFNCIFLNENVWIPIKSSLKFASKGPIINIPALV